MGHHNLLESAPSLFLLENLRGRTVKLEERIACSATDPGVCYHDVHGFVRGLAARGFEHGYLVVPGENIAFDELCISTSFV